MENQPAPGEPAAVPITGKKGRPMRNIALLLGVALLYLIVSAPHSDVPPAVIVNRAIAKCQALGLVLAKYAGDHGGKYPVGKTSTDAFQQLIDGGYLTDVSLLYYPMPGKTPATGKTLIPQNVCWDLTGGVDGDSPGALPVIFSTGYRVPYVPGQVTLMSSRTWAQWWDSRTFSHSFWAYCNHAGEASSLSTVYRGEVVFLPADLDLRKRQYQQLTPDGAIPQ